MRRRWMYVRVVPALASIALTVGGGPAGVGAIYRAIVGSPVPGLLAGAPAWRFGTTPLAAEVIGVADVSCGSQRSCLAIGLTAGIDTVLLRSTDGGLRWTERPAPARIGSFSAVACVSALRCLATTSSGFLGFSASGVAISVDGGLTWRPERSLPAPRSGYWGVLRCPTRSVCYVLNAQARGYRTGGIERTTDFGRHWTLEHVSGPLAGAITGVQTASCGRASACVAIADWSRTGKRSPVLQTSDGGATWRVRVAPVAGLGLVSCGGGSDCLAEGDASTGMAAVASTDGGVTWHLAAAIRAIENGLDATCTGARDCLVVGQTGAGLGNDGVIARTTDLGRHWTISRTTRGAGYLSAVSCPSVTHCVAGRESSGQFSPTPLGSQGFEVSDNAGASWRPAGLPLAIADLQGVACPVPSVCYAVGGTTGRADDAIVLRSGDGGRTWRVALVTGRSQTLADISCPTATRCVAVGTLNFGNGNVIIRTDDGGRRWSIAASPRGVNSPDQVSCPTTTFCEVLARANGGAGFTRLLRSTDGGRRWQVSRPPRGVAYLLGLSCPTSQVCTAVGDGTYPPGPPIIVRTTDGGLRWTRQRPPRGANIVESVSCPDTRTCYALNDTMPVTVDVTRDGGARWTTEQVPGSGDVLPSDISCGTTRACAGAGLGIGFAGAIFQTTNGRSWRQSRLPVGVDDPLGVTCGRRGCAAVGIDGQILLSGAAG